MIDAQLITAEAYKSVFLRCKEWFLGDSFRTDGVQIHMSVVNAKAKEFSTR